MQQDDMFRALSTGATVLTGNNRLARHIKHRYDRHQQHTGERVWQRADVMPLDTWLYRLLADLHAEGATDRRLLQPVQRQLLWEQVLREHTDGTAYLNAQAMASSLQQAYTTARAYGYAFSDERSSKSIDQRAFVRWAEAYHHLCDERAVLDPADVITHLMSDACWSRMRLPSHLMLVGFYEITPQQQCLLDALLLQNVRIDQISQSSAQSVEHARVSPQEDIAELAAAASWARTELEKNARARLAVVVPDLQNRRTELEYQFRRAFFPQRRPDTLTPADCPWNFSLGLPLANTPPAQTALLLLKLAGNAIDADDFTRLLLSPFLGDADTERDARARLAVDERLRRQRQFTLAELIPLSRRSAPRLHKRLQRLQNALPRSRQLPGYWADRIGKLLDVVGWPGEQTLSSDAYQQVSALRDTVHALAALDDFSTPLSLREAGQMLARTASQTLFQAQTEDVPVQVLGLLEVSGLSFDAAWVCEMDSGRWPPVGRPNPYLPLAWQRDVGAPHASAQRELAYSAQLFESLQRLAPQVLFSHVGMRDDTPIKPAAAIADLPSVAAMQPSGVCADSPIDAVLDEQCDVYGPAVAAGDKVSGGSGLLARQAECPFHAFMQYRLFAREVEDAELGIDPRDRGLLLHRVLEDFWRDARDQEVLLGLPEAQLQSRVTELTQKATEDYRNLYRLSALERERVEEVALQWLAFEKQRPPFSVEEVEVARDIDFEGLRIHLIIDRIDSVYVDNGANSRVIIDYKTGTRHDPRSWMLARPGEPQLPLYAVTEETPVSGIAFALLDRRVRAFRGYTDGDALLPEVGLPALPDPDHPRRQVPITWEDALTHWRQQLGALAQEICDGYAGFLSDACGCRYCDSGLLMSNVYVPEDKA